MTSPETEFVSILGAAEKAEATPRISSRSLPDTVPILGLSDIVIFPGAVVPLLVETGPSLKLIDDIVAGDRLFGAVLQRKPEIAEPAPDDLHEVGCISRLSKMVKFPDGTVRVLVEGLWRIHLKKFSPPDPYLRASYELLRDETEDSVELQAMLRNAHKQFEEIAKMSTALTDQVKIAALNTEHPGHFADLIAGNLNLSLEDRQKLLETVSVRERLQKLLPMLNREQEVLTLSSKIQSDVASSIAKTQRDFFLREQMRAIQRELGEGEAGSGESKSLREKIEQAILPPDVRKAAEQELERLQQTNTRSRAIISTGS
jgi:ATP-dependent Lon protease